MQGHLPGPIWGEYSEDEGRRIDALFADADLLDGKGLGYEAEAVAHAAAILAERAGLHIAPSAPVAQLVEPGQRARAAGRSLPYRDGSPEAQLRLWQALAAYSEQDGHYEEAAGLREEAADLAVELGPARVPAHAHPALPAIPDRATATGDGYVIALEMRSEAHNVLAGGYEEAARVHRRLGYDDERAVDEVLQEAQIAHLRGGKR